MGKVEEAGDRGLELVEVTADGCGHDRVRRVEVPVRELITHRGDLPPGDGWLAVEQVCWQGLDGLADLQEADAHRVEHQAIGQVAPGASARGWP